MLDVANGIEGLGDVIRYGNENIVETIGQSGEQILKGLAIIGSTLDSIDYQMEMVNSSLGVISNQLEELLKKISKPNETEALELADQARINLSLKKKEIALKVTRDALEISNGTSITVLAYHILTLSLFDDEASRKEIIEIYEDYVNLIAFKLSDRQSDTDVVAQEIYNTLYPVMATMGNRIDDHILLLTQMLYVSLCENRTKIDNALKKPLYHSATLELITHPNQLREYHWGILLREYVVKKQSLDIYIAYINALAKSNVLIKNELMILAVKHFYEDGFLYGAIVDSLAGNKDEKLNDALKIIFSLLPHEIIDINNKTYFAVKLYADHCGSHAIKVSETLKTKFAEAVEYVKNDIENKYIAFFDKSKKELYDKGKEITSKIEAIKKEHLEVSQRKMEEWEKHNEAIANKGYDKKIENAKGQLSTLRPKLGSDSITVVFTILGGLIAIATAIGAFTDGEIFVGLIMITFGTLIFSGIGFVAGIVINVIVNAIRESTTSSLESSIPEYRKELAKKHNISVKKRKLDAPYDQKIATLCNDLKEYKQKKIDIIDSKLKLLISKYIPIHIEQLSQSENKLKEYIGKKMLGKFIFSKRPNDLKYKQEDISNTNPVSQVKKKYVEIDIEKLAIDYGARWRELHSGEQPTTEKMISWIESLANNGDAKAQYLLGTIYEDDDEAYGIEADKQKALSWFEKAANNGIAEAQCILGSAYWGNHKEYNLSQDLAISLEWFKKARDLGHPSGKYNYGLLHFYGVGVDENREDGIHWIKEAADDGLQAAQDFITKEGLE